MGHTYASSLFHCVFSTKNRERSIGLELRPRLWEYMGGVARQNGMKALAIGGTENHVHILLSIPATTPLAKAVQTMKAVSSKWVHESLAAHRDFGWQEGYGAFSISVSQVPSTIAYIRTQEEHHRKRDFQEEFIAFLKKHGIEYDSRYVFG